MKLLAKWLDLIVFRFLTQRRLRMSPYLPDKGRLQAYLDPELLTHPDSFYILPDTVPAITDSLTRLKRGAGYDVYDFQFPSAITSPWPENNTVYGRYFKTQAAAAAPTVIVLHGWLAFNYVWYTGICRRLAKAGMNSLMLQLPYHMQRRPRESRYSGEFTICGDLNRSMEAIRQSVVDTRSVVNWLQASGSPGIGVWGVSLGGWIGALTAAVEPRLDVAVLMIPAVRPDDVMWHSAMCPPLKDVVASNGISYEQVQALLKIATPKYLLPRLPPERILLIEAEVDQGVRPHTIEEFWEAWGRPRRLRYPCGHISIVLSSRALKDATHFIRSVFDSSVRR